MTDRWCIISMLIKTNVNEEHWIIWEILLFKLLNKKFKESSNYTMQLKFTKEKKIMLVIICDLRMEKMYH